MDGIDGGGTCCVEGKATQKAKSVQLQLNARMIEKVSLPIVQYSVANIQLICRSVSQERVCTRATLHLNSLKRWRSSYEEMGYPGVDIANKDHLVQEILRIATASHNQMTRRPLDCPATEHPWLSCQIAEASNDCKHILASANPQTMNHHFEGLTKEPNALGWKAHGEG